MLLLDAANTDANTNDVSNKKRHQIDVEGLSHVLKVATQVRRFPFLSFRF